MIMCVLLCYPVSIHMSQLLSTGRPVSSYTIFLFLNIFLSIMCIMHIDYTIVAQSIKTIG